MKNLILSKMLDDTNDFYLHRITWSITLAQIIRLLLN